MIREAEFRWDPNKNEKLKEDGRPSFDELLPLVTNRQVTRYPHKSNAHQFLIIVTFNYYPVVIVCEDRGYIWLVTAYPCRDFKLRLI